MQRKKYIDIVEAFGFSFGVLGVYSLHHALYGTPQAPRRESSSRTRISRDAFRHGVTPPMASGLHWEHFVYGGLVIPFNQFLLKKISIQPAMRNHQLKVKYFGSSVCYFVPYYFVLDSLEGRGPGEVVGHLARDCPWLVSARLVLSGVIYQLHSRVVSQIRRQRECSQSFQVSP